MVASRLFNPVTDQLQNNLLLKWRLARQLTTRNARIMIVTDSYGRGQSTGGGTAQSNNSWPSQMATKLQARGINAGANGIFGDGGCWGQAATAANMVSGESRIVFSGGATLTATKGPGGQAWSLPSAGSIAITPAKNVTKFVIYERDGAVGRNFNWQVDGGATTEIDSSGTTRIRATTVSAGASGAHTLTLNWVLGSVTILGVDAYDDTGGRTEISIWNHGICGAKAGDMLDNTDALAGRLAFWTAYPPDLTIICPIINNWRSAIGVAQTQTDVQAIITKAIASGSVLMMTPPYDGGVSGDAAIQDQYVSMFSALAATNNVALADFRSTLGSYAIGNAAGAYSDTVHGNQLIYGDIAEQIIDLII